MTTYEEAGVNIDSGNDFVKSIRDMAKSTHIDGVLGDIGGFGGLFQPSKSGMEMRDPVLVSSTDGVGTKLKVASLVGNHETIGIDLVAMSVNDVAAQGAKPMFFLDYLSMGKLDTDIATSIIKGIVKGCKIAKCALIGGETAEMPGMYAEGEYDLAGFAVGMIEKTALIDGRNVSKGDKLIGIASSGLHSNGYSLVRKVFSGTLNREDAAVYNPDLGCSLAEELLKPTKIYSNLIWEMLLLIGGAAHITGGGILENNMRMLPKGYEASIYGGSWEVPPIFGLIQRLGNIDDGEMLRTFNMGIGMILSVKKELADFVLDYIETSGEKGYVIGEVI